jgi:radical SAM superfamily enzyme YgiQ (UPF0313 family)
MNVLLTYPEYPASFFSFTYALDFISKKASVPPLGLITISALLPASWQRRLVDMNVTPLLDHDLEWADYVFIGAMHIQKASVNQIIEACAGHQVKLVAGGPLFTYEFASYPQIDHFILNEAEITLPLFLKDLFAKKAPKRVYRTNEFADIGSSPVPHYHLLSKKAYASINMQLSRGCPFSCDFCEIPVMLGNKVRMKKTEQMIRELEALYQWKWRGSVSIVDDNLIGNKLELKKHLLPALITWMKQHKYPFIFNIQTSINLADDPELIGQMLDAGINSTFIGIETPSERSNRHCQKIQNTFRDLLKNVREIQQAGMLVSGGFILGFDSDTRFIFDQQVDFIQQSGIVWAMIGLLNAPKNTRLYQRLEKEKRITTEVTGNNTDFSMNFIPKMDRKNLLRGYQSVLEHTYGIKPYYQRIRQCLLNLRPTNRKCIRIDSYYFIAFIRSIYKIGIKDKGRGDYWKILIWTLWHRPRFFPYAIMFIICGYHFRKLYGVQEINTDYTSKRP